MVIYVAYITSFTPSNTVAGCHPVTADDAAAASPSDPAATSSSSDCLLLAFLPPPLLILTLRPILFYLLLCHLLLPHQLPSPTLVRIKLYCTKGVTTKVLMSTLTNFMLPGYDKN